MKTFATKALDYYLNLPREFSLPDGISVMNPYSDPEVKRVTTAFFKKFYDDTKPRIPLIGINPGRFGGGITGIAFTDPVALQEHCEIPNQLGNKRELSSKFVYQLIESFGGPRAFFGRFYLGAIFPLALIRDKKNFNYYDSPELIEALEEDILSNLKTQISFGLKTENVVCLGRKNLTHLRDLNEKADLFKNLCWLEHPRFIQQYKAKQVGNYIEKYKLLLSGI